MNIRLLAYVLPFLLGCGSEAIPSTAIHPENRSAAVFESAEEDESKHSPSGPASDSVHQRKIIFNCEFSLRTESMDEIVPQIEGLTKENRGFLSSVQMSGQSGSYRAGCWVIRIPVENYRTFVNAVGQFGEVESRYETSQEVTTEFVDVQARIRNKQAEEKRLVTMLGDRTGKLEDVLLVEKEITRVRGEVEGLQGRMRVLKDLSSLSTVTLRVHELQKFVSAESPGFGTRIVRRWNSTLDSLARFGQELILLLVGAGPWLAIIGVGFMVSRGILKRYRSSVGKPA